MQVQAPDGRWRECSRNAATGNSQGRKPLGTVTRRAIQAPTGRFHLSPVRAIPASVRVSPLQGSMVFDADRDPGRCPRCSTHLRPLDDGFLRPRKGPRSVAVGEQPTDNEGLHRKPAAKRRRRSLRRYAALRRFMGLESAGCRPPLQTWAAARPLAIQDV